MPESAIAHPLREADAIVDVRSPLEFERGAIPDAVNRPLFSNGERAEIGTLYKQLGREPAIQRGLEQVGGRLADFAAGFEPYRAGRLLVYCARGGMRSQAVVSLLASLGYRARQLPGGYKAYRAYLLAELARRVPPHPIVIHGRTGVGKTLLLQRLPNALDLEAIARHRSSLFGAVNLRPRTQQQFEAHLLQRLEALDAARPAWVEGESRKVGAVILPEALRAAMQAAPCVLLTASLETRVSRIIAEYAGAGAAPEPDTLAQLEAALRSLARFFGRPRVDALAQRLRAGDLRPVVRALLEEYYDPRYDHAMRNYRYAQVIPGDDLDAAVDALLALDAAWPALPAPPPQAPSQGAAEAATG
jgi:tRNA 2-selenouridine synthase